MEFIEPNAVNRPGLAVGQNDCFANKLTLSLIEFGKDRARSFFGNRHSMTRSGSDDGGVAHESVQLMTDAWQRDVRGTRVPLAAARASAGELHGRRTCMAPR